MQEAFGIVVLVLLAFPLGMGLAVFLDWMGRQKPNPAHRRVVADLWRWLANWGVLFHLGMGLWKAAERDWRQVGEHAVQCAAFVSLGLGAWLQARRSLPRGER